MYLYPEYEVYSILFTHSCRNKKIPDQKNAKFKIETTENGIQIIIIYLFKYHVRKSSCDYSRKHVRNDELIQSIIGQKQKKSLKLIGFQKFSCDVARLVSYDLI
jgi:hypothetical protein